MTNVMIDRLHKIFNSYVRRFVNLTNIIVIGLRIFPLFFGHQKDYQCDISWLIILPKKKVVEMVSRFPRYTVTLVSTSRVFSFVSGMK